MSIADHFIIPNQPLEVVEADLIRQLGIGNDITKVWLNLTRTNRHTRELDFINNNVRSFFVNNFINVEILLSDFAPQYIPIANKIKGQLIADRSYRWVLLLLQSTDNYPLQVNLIKVAITEELFAHANLSLLPIELTQLLLKFTRSIIEELTHLLSTFNDSLLEEEQALEELSKLFLITPSQEHLYDIALAFSLRQLPVGSINAFLDYQYESYEGDFLDFLEAVLLDYSSLLIEKTIQGVNWWLQSKVEIRQKEQLAVLEKSINDVFPFSSDISCIRDDVNSVYQRLKDDKAVRKYLIHILFEKEAIHQEFLDRGMHKEAQQAKCSLILDRPWHKLPQLEQDLQLLKTKPYDIYPEAIALVENAYYLGNRNDEIYEPIYRKSLIRKESSYSEFGANVLPKQGLEEKQALRNFYHKWIGNPMQSGDDGFELYFAYALRQMKKSKIASFLNHQLNVCQQPLVPLLLSILQDYKPVLQNETVRIAQEWMEKNKPRLAHQKAEIEKQRLKVLDSYFKIDTGLSYDEIIECFTFLYEAKDQNGNAFLSKADFDQIFRFGLAMPADLPSPATYKLYIDKSNFSRGVIYHFLNRFAKHVEMRKRRRCPTLRKELARFLVCYFQNFRIEGDSEERLINKVRRQINNCENLPKKAGLFDFGEYWTG